MDNIDHVNNTAHGFVRNVQVQIPELGNNTADVERLKSALKKQLSEELPSMEEPLSMPWDLAGDLARKLRKWDHRVKVVLFKDSRGWIVTALEEPGEASSIYGIAADLGTTRIVLRLIDLETGKSLGERGFDNPQVEIAPDVLARIHHAGKEKGLRELQKLVIKGMNINIEALCGDAGVSSQAVYLLVAAGNTAMTHLFLGIEPSFIIREPYIPAVNAPEPMESDALGLSLHPRGMVFLFPNIGSYFGGDLISGILYAELHKKEEPCLMVDVGTNAEVVIGNRDWLIACAGAAGPALEGGISDMGMTAGPGVIDRVTIDPVTLKIDIHTIDDKPAIGICGSGMIDLAAQLFLSGMIDIRGKFVKERCGDRLFEKDEINCFCLVDSLVSGTGKDIVLTQVDMNSLTSSKAAMHSILEVIIVQTAGLQFIDIAKFYVAGTFGSFINPISAISIGMLPDIPINKFEVLGNSSLGGAAKLLTNPAAFKEIEEIRQGITYIELNVNQEFMNIFSGAKFYPHTDRSRFPSVHFHDDNCH